MKWKCILLIMVPLSFSRKQPSNQDVKTFEWMELCAFGTIQNLKLPYIAVFVPWLCINFNFMAWGSRSSIYLFTPFKCRLEFIIYPNCSASLATDACAKWTMWPKPHLIPTVLAHDFEMAGAMRACASTSTWFAQALTSAKVKVQTDQQRAAHAGLLLTMAAHAVCQQAAATGRGHLHQTLRMARIPQGLKILEASIASARGTTSILHSGV